MIQIEVANRRTSNELLKHIYFWTPTRKIMLVCELSDYIETHSSIDNSMVLT